MAEKWIQMPKVNVINGIYTFLWDNIIVKHTEQKGNGLYGDKLKQGLMIPYGGWDLAILGFNQIKYDIKKLVYVSAANYDINGIPKILC